MEIRPERIEIITTSPALMTWSERVVLYSTIFGTRPKRCLEIGTHKGGSALIITAALDDIGEGKIICVDPSHQITPENLQKISHRASLVTGRSPEIIAEASNQAGGLFDFALIDGDHEFEGVMKDIEGVVPFLADNAFLIFHDAHYFGVSDAIDATLKTHKNLIDCGMISVEETREGRFINERAVVWGGLRLLRYKATVHEDAE